MVASVLNSPKAVEVSVFVVRAFVKLRQLAGEHRELAKKLSQLEKKLQTHDTAIQALISAIRGLMVKPVPPKRQIGFHSDLDKK